MAHQAQLNDAHLQMATGRIPPSWCPERDRAYPFRHYVSDMLLWNEATDLDIGRRGPAAALRLTGAAKILVREMEPDQLRDGIVIADANNQPLQLTGVQTLLRALERRYAPLEQESQVHAIHELFSFRRGHSESVDEVIARFEVTVHRAQNIGNVQIGEPVLAWMVLSHLGVSENTWPLALAPTLGMLPQNRQQYTDFLIYMRRQGHLSDTNQDIAKNPRQQYFTLHDQKSQASHGYFAGSEAQWQPQDYWQPQQQLQAWEPTGSAAWTVDASFFAESAADDDESSGASQWSQPADLSDLANLTEAEKGEALYHAYIFAKKRFRQHTRQPSRRHGKGKGKGKRSKGKGKFSQFGGGKSSFLTQDEYQWSPSPWQQDEMAYAFQKGHGKSRTNPVGSDGKIMRCLTCGSENHFRNKCPQGSGSAHASSSGKGSKPSSSAGGGGYVVDPPLANGMIDNAMGIGHWMPGQSYFAAASDSLPGSAIVYPDGTREPLQPQQSSGDSEPAGTASKRGFLSSMLMFVTNAFAWWHGSYHTMVRMKEGEGLLVDCGAVSNLCGSKWASRTAAAAAAAGQGSVFKDIASQPIHGVGQGSSDCTKHAVLPICMSDGKAGTFSSNVVADSELPALLGL